MGKDDNPLEDLDWDSALAEWEKNTFVPEVARDADTNTVPGRFSHEEPPAAPGPPRPAAGTPATPAADLRKTAPGGAPRAAADLKRTAPGGAPPRAPASLTELSSDGTVIAPVPSELRNDPSPSGRHSAAPPRRGGLSQLFSRPPPRPEKKDAPSVTREVVAAPREPEPQADPTLVGRGVADAARRAHEARARDHEEEPTHQRAPLAPKEIEAITRGAALADDLDQDTATVVADRPRAGSLSDAETATRHPSDAEAHPADDEAPTFARSSTQPPPMARASRPRASAPEGPTEFEGERPVSRWLDEETTAAYRQRARWLEEEARATEDPVQRARILLTVSELSALVGDRDAAFQLAIEARVLAPALPLAWRQARQLMPRDARELAAQLEAEAAQAPTPAARAHAILLEADVLRTNGDGDGAVERWLQAYRLDPADVRAPAARAALALAQDDHTSAASDLAENSELVAIGRAVATALRLRGVERPGGDAAEMPINDGLRRARAALEGEDVVAAAQAMVEVAREPTLAKASLWLSAALGATHIAGRRGAAKALKALANDGDELARRQLAARGVELADPELVTHALGGDAPFELAERAALLALAGQDVAPALDRLDDEPALAPLADALTALAPSNEDREARVRRAAGSPDARVLTGLGRLLADAPSVEAIDRALEPLIARSPSAAGVALEVAGREKRWDQVVAVLSSLPAGDDETASAQRHIAAAIVAERAGDAREAARAWREALAEGAIHDSIVRAVKAAEPHADMVRELLRIADEMPDGPASAILRLEALARGDFSDDQQAEIFERVHRAAPSLGLGAFLGERVARRKGDLDEVLRWIQERRAYVADPLETALDAVREALLVADRDADLASTRLEEAHRAQPDDVALRELYERLAVEPPTDAAAWREARAEKSAGPTRALLFVEAALDHERRREHGAALAAAERALAAGDKGLARLVLERAEVEMGDTARQTDDLIARAREADDDAVRREIYERLADLDRWGRKDASNALLWHRTILDETPRHQPSLRYVEHALLGAGRDDELEPIFEEIARALDGTGGGETAAHAQVAARILARAPAPGANIPKDMGHVPIEGGWERTAAMARLAATQPEASLWSLRALNAHARVAKDDDAILKTTLALLERTSRPSERAALLLRASEVAARLEHVADARAFLEQAAQEDPGDVVTWGFLAEVRERAGEARAAAEACESLARTSLVADHQLLAWYDAARIWLDEVRDPERGMAALEQCASIDATHQDVFPRLSQLYAERHLDAELARLLETRLQRAEDEGERVTLEVDLAHALAEMGEVGRARQALERALEHQPDHTAALGALADTCEKEGDYDAAEQAYVRLTRLLTSPAEQKDVYAKLADIYANHLVNLSRAEVAYREVLKRAPNDADTLEKLVDVYKRQGDVSRAVETQQQIVADASGEPQVRLFRLVELAQIHETVGRDLRRAEQVLESARKEFPTSVQALRALAEFYQRQHQMPAMQILLDRAASDARRSFAGGRFVTSLFEVLHAAYELRGRSDAARVVAATLAAVEGQPAELAGADARALDPRLDELLAPDMMSPALRALLARAGDALDVTAPMDLRALHVTPLAPGTPIGATIGAIATVIGLGALQILVSPQLGRKAVPIASNPPTILVGEGLVDATNAAARAFVVVRALKMVLTRASAVLRGSSTEVAELVAALLAAFNPSFIPQGVDARRVQDLARRVVPALPRNLDPNVGVIALEAAGTLGAGASQLSAAASRWANRVALLAIGDPNGALDAVAWSRGEDAAPRGSEERAAWIARNAEARDLMAFSVTDAYAEARARVGLDR